MGENSEVARSVIPALQYPLTVLPGKCYGSMRIAERQKVRR